MKQTQNYKTCIRNTIQDMYWIQKMCQIFKTYRQTNNIKTNNLFTKYTTNYQGLHPYYLCDNLRILHSNKL